MRASARRSRGSTRSSRRPLARTSFPSDRDTVELDGIDQVIGRPIIRETDRLAGAGAHEMVPIFFFRERGQDLSRQVLLNANASASTGMADKPNFRKAFCKASPGALPLVKMAGEEAKPDGLVRSEGPSSASTRRAIAGAGSI